MRLLLVPYNFPPESYGGTEVYVEGLARELLHKGHRVDILCGGTQPVPGTNRFALDSETYNGLPVWRLRLDGSRFTMPEMYTTRAADLRSFWGNWLAEHRPDVVHLHGHSLTVSLSLAEAAADRNIPVVSTVHNIPWLCPRGDYITWRGPICDGRVELVKCTRCFTATRLGGVAGLAMSAVAPFLARIAVPQSTGWSKIESGFHYPGLLRLQINAQGEMLGIVRRWHVFSEWSRQALERNGVPREKIILLRHPLPEEVSSRPPRSKQDGVLRLGFFGRLHPHKGLQVLLDAIRQIPDAPLQLEVFGEGQNDSESAVVKQLRAAAQNDRRIIMRGRIPHSDQPSALAQLDLVVVPSIWVETGPFTVLESFAAGLPVVGSNLSGINEWVSEGRNGWLFPAGDSAALAERLKNLSADRQMLESACQFPPLDSMASHAGKVEQIYDSLFATHLSQTPQALHGHGGLSA